jgi:hypothetical protein
MRLIAATAFALAMVAFTPSAASADVTLFYGTTNSPGHPNARGFAAGMSLLIVGFEFEYGNTSEDLTVAQPSLRTISGNVSAQTVGIPAVQLYLTTGAGMYTERLGADEENAFALNTGGGIKLSIKGPLRLRVDYRIFSLQGNPQRSTVQRVYAGLNLKF